MIIRKAGKTDIDSLLELNRQIGEYHHDNAPNIFVGPNEAEREFLLQALNDLERFFLVATLDEKVVGFLTATINKNEMIPFIAKDPICRVGTIVVDQNHRSSGIGQALMKTCKEWAETSGAVEIRLEVMEFNAKAQDFYHKLGFNTQSRIMSHNLSD